MAFFTLNGSDLESVLAPLKEPKKESENEKEPKKDTTNEKEKEKKKDKEKETTRYKIPINYLPWDLKSNYQNLKSNDPKRSSVGPEWEYPKESEKKKGLEMSTKRKIEHCAQFILDRVVWQPLKEYLLKPISVDLATGKKKYHSLLKVSRRKELEEKKELFALEDLLILKSTCIRVMQGVWHVMSTKDQIEFNQHVDEQFRIKRKLKTVEEKEYDKQHPVKKLKTEPLDLKPYLGKIFVQTHSYRRPDLIRVIGYTAKRLIVESVPVHVEKGEYCGTLNESWLEKNPVDLKHPVTKSEKNESLAKLMSDSDLEEEGETFKKSNGLSLLYEGNIYSELQNQKCWSWCEY